jgi:hypothetical protein
MDGEGLVDYQSSMLRVCPFNFQNHLEFESGLKRECNQHRDSYEQIYPLGTHMHNNKYAV